MNTRTTLTLAVVQTRLRMLEPCVEELTDATDIRAYNDLKADLADYISRRTEEGETVADPLEFIFGVLEDLDGVITETDHCLANCKRYGNEILHPTRKTLSRDILARYPSDLHEFSERMRHTLEDIWHSYPIDDWCVDYELLPDLVFIAQKMRPDLNMHHLPHRDLIEFVHLSGKCYSEAGKHFTALAEKCGKLLQSHMQQGSDLATAQSHLHNGNYIQARKQVERLSPYFTDIDGDPILKECEVIAKRVEEQRDRIKKVREQALTPPDTSFADRFNPWGVKAKAAARHHVVENFRSSTNQFQQRAMEHPSSDYAKESTELASVVLRQCSGLDAEIDAMFHQMQRTARLNLLKIGAALAGLVVLVAAGIIVQQVRERDAHDWEPAAKAVKAAETIDEINNAVAACKEYLKNHPLGSHHQEAMVLSDITLPKKIEDHKKQKLAESAKDDHEAWDRAVALEKTAGTSLERIKEAFQLYLKEYPEGAHAADAHAMVEKTLPKKIEDRDWQAIPESAKSAPTDDTWDHCDLFIQKYPTSTWVTEALKLRESAGVKSYADAAHKGQESIAARDWSGAYAHFMRALKYNPRDPAALFLLLKYKPYEQPPATALNSLTGTHGNVTALAISPDGRFALAGHGNGTLTLWDVVEGREARLFKGHTGSINGVAFSPDGKFAVSGGDDQSIRSWEVMTGNQVKMFHANPGKITSLAISPDGNAVLAGRIKDPLARLYDMTTGNELRAFQGHGDCVNSMAFSKDGKSVITGGSDCTLKLWDTAKGKVLRNFSGHLKPITGVAISPDGKLALSASKDGTLRLWPLDGGKETIIQSHPDYTTSVAFSPDSKFALTGNSDGTISLYDIANKKEARVLPAHTELTTTVTYSPDSNIAFSAGKDGAIKIWNLWEADKAPPAK